MALTAPKIPSYPYRISMALRKEYTLTDQPTKPNTGWGGYQHKREPTMQAPNILVYPTFNCFVPDGDKVVPDLGKTLLGQPFTANQQWGAIGHQKNYTNNNGDVLELRVTKTTDPNLKDVIEVLYTNPLTNIQKWWQITQNSNPIARGNHEYYFTSWFDTTLEGASLNVSRSIWTNGTSNVMSWTGGTAPIISVSGSTLTTLPGKTWASLGFISPVLGGSGNITVNGVLYTITAGWGTQTVTLTSTAGILAGDVAFDQIEVDPITVPAVLAYGSTNSFLFISGETVTGSISGATAVILSNQQGAFMTLQDIVGTFQVGETITGSTSNATGSVTAYSPTSVTFDVCSSFKNYVVYGSWSMRNFYMSNNYNRVASQNITNAQAAQNDLVVSGSYTGTGQHTFRVTIDSVHPAINTQSLTSTQGGSPNSYFVTSGYTGIGKNTYVMTIIADSVFTPFGGSRVGHFLDGELIVGQTSGTVLKLIEGAANDFAGGGALTQYISGTPDTAGNEQFLGLSSGATVNIFGFGFTNSAQLFKNNVQVLGLTGSVGDGVVEGVLQFALTGTQIVVPSEIDGLQFVTTSVGSNYVGDYFTLVIQTEAADTFQVQVDGAAPLAGETGIPIVPATAILTVSGITGTFQVGERVTDTNGATGIISSISGSTFNLYQVIGVFGVSDTFAGQQSQATATVVTFTPTAATQPLYQIAPNGVLISFISSIGHTVGDFWDITVNQSISKGWVNFYYTVPVRRPGEGFVGLLPSNFWAEIQQENMMYVNDAHGGWSTIETKLSANLQSETITVEPLKGTSQSKAIFPYMLGYLDNNIVYVNTEKKLDMIGRKAFIQLPQIGHLSDPVKYDFLAASFVGGSVEFWDQKFWISSPREGITFCYDNMKKYWQPPKLFPEVGIMSVVFQQFLEPSNGILTFTSGTGTFSVNEKVVGQTSGIIGYVASIAGSTLNLYNVLGQFQLGESILGMTSGATGVVSTYTAPPQQFTGQDVLICHSNSRNQSFTMFTSRNGDNGQPYKVLLRTPPNAYGNRWGQKETSMSFIEGYVTGIIPFIQRVILEPNGEGGIYPHNVEYVVGDIPDRAPFGEGNFGSHPFASDQFVEGAYFREIYKKYAPVLSYYFAALELEATALNHSWSLLSMGINSVGGLRNNKTLVNPSTVIK